MKQGKQPFHFAKRLATMVPETFTQILRAYARRKPFKPFLVELMSGERILVEHPEALAYNGGAAVYISPRGGFAMFDHESVAQVLDLNAEPSVS
jgi:hypothetical protein